jgi:hypothetical protein
MNPLVQQVQVLPDYRLALVFSNGEHRIFDVSPYLEKGVFQQLRDPERFKAVTVVAGSIEWPGEIDLSYDTVYLQGEPVKENNRLLATP